MTITRRPSVTHAMLPFGTALDPRTTFVNIQLSVQACILRMITGVGAASNCSGLDVLAASVKLLHSAKESGAPNPAGINQHRNCPSKESKQFQDLLREYHKTTTSRTEVRGRLLKEHGIAVSDRTISRRWREMGLLGSRQSSSTLSTEETIRLVANEMAKDPEGRMGQGALKARIAINTNIHLRKRTVAGIQRMLDPEGVLGRSPSAKQVRSIALTSGGPNEVWNCDGYDKLAKYGFAIWGLRDKFSRKWLGLWVLPNNHIEMVVAYLWLTVVKELGGMPKQSSTDCGTESSIICELAKTLRDAFATNHECQKPARVFMRSVHHIPIERDCLNLRKEFDRNTPQFWGSGSAIFKEEDPVHQNIALVLLPPLMQRELDKFRKVDNNRRIRKQKGDDLPSGVTSEFAYGFPERFGGHDCLIPVDTQVIDEILANMEVEKKALTDWSVSLEFTASVHDALQRLQVDEKDITLQNVWYIFGSILTLL